MGHSRFCRMFRIATILGGIIVNIGKWLWNPTKFFVVGFCSLFWHWPCKNTIVVNSVLRNSCIVYGRKTKDFARSWTFQPKSWHLCLLLWCLPGFIFRFINYGGIDCHWSCLCFFSFLRYVTFISSSTSRSRWYPSRMYVIFSKAFSRDMWHGEAMADKWVIRVHVQRGIFFRWEDWVGIVLPILSPGGLIGQVVCVTSVRRWSANR